MNVSEQIILLMNYLMSNWMPLYVEYCKQTGIWAFRWRLENFRHWAIYHKYDLAKMLHSEYKKYNLKDNGNYIVYLDWCEYMEYTPYSNTIFSNNDNIKAKKHESLLSLEFTRWDNSYIESTHYLYEWIKVPVINQNMCLFYKFYFKRYAHRKNSEKVSW